MNLIANPTLQTTEIGAEHKLSRLAKWEYAVPALAVASLIVSCIIVSSKRYFWIDELETYLLVADRSFRANESTAPTCKRACAFVFCCSGGRVTRIATLLLAAGTAASTGENFARSTAAPYERSFEMSAR